MRDVSLVISISLQIIAVDLLMEGSLLYPVFSLLCINDCMRNILSMTKSINIIKWSPLHR